MNIVVSGSASFVGNHIIRELIKRDSKINIYAMVRPNSKHNEILLDLKDKINVVEIDMANIESLKDYVSSIDAFYMVSWRGTRGNDRADENMQLQNYLDSVKACKVAIELGAKSIIGVGSQAEYGITYDNVSEDYNAKPITPYGVYKLRTFNECSDLCAKNKVAFKWGRIFSAYGVGDYENTLVMYCIHQMRNNLEVISSPCTQMWNYINIKDVANLFVELLTETIPSGAYNFSSFDTRVLKSYVYEIRSILNSSSIIKFGATQNNIKLMNLLPINSKLIQYLPEYNFIPFSDGIREIIRDMEKQK